MHRKIQYSLAKFSDCFDADGRKILSFTIRTTDGSDEAYASKRADAKGSGMPEELVRVSLVSYQVEGEGDKEVKQPFEGFDKWSTKSRNFVVAAWKKLATPDDTEIADFFGSATESE